MLCYPAFQVNSAPRVGAFRLPLEVNLLTLGVLVGHFSSVDDIFVTHLALGSILSCDRDLDDFVLVTIPVDCLS